MIKPNLIIINFRQDQLNSEIQRTIQKRDSIKLKYSSRDVDLTRLPKIKGIKKNHATQVGRTITALKG